MEPKHPGAGSDDLFAGHIPLMRPWLGEEEAAAAREVILSGWVSLGPRVAEFEAQVAALVGAGHAVATNAATTALHLALKVAGVEPGDEVICASLTCMANANAIIMAGATPRFADVERETYNLDPEDVERRITARTRAVMAIDQIGLPCDLDALAAICRRRGLILIDDAATAFGAKYKGRYLGGAGVPTCYSFHPRKMITTGEGGMLVTDDAGMAERARVLRSAGASVSDLERHKAKGTIPLQYFEAGYNYRMTDIQAAVGLVQLKKLPEIVRQRREQARFYETALAGLEEVRPPREPSWAEHAWSSYCVRLTPRARVTAPEVVTRMAERGVSCRRGITPLHDEPYFQAATAGLSLPETEAASRETLFLPIFPGLSEAQLVHVTRALQESLRP